jgi:hypothetical protein
MFHGRGERQERGARLYASEDRWAGGLRSSSSCFRKHGVSSVARRCVEDDS